MQNLIPHCIHITNNLSITKRFMYCDQQGKMLFCTILVVMAPFCLAKPFDAEKVMATLETLQVSHLRNMV